MNFQIKVGNPRPIFKQIVDSVGQAIVSGELTEGEQLPSVRALGMQLSINPNTVAKAYAELTSMGLVDARQGLGLFVSAPKQTLSNSERKKRLQSAVHHCINDVMHLHFSDEEILRAMKNNLATLRSVSKTGKSA